MKRVTARSTREQIKTLQVWNDGGESINRYIVIWPNGDYIKMDETPLHIQGFCMHGTRAEYDPDCAAMGEKLYSHIGRMIGFEDLPVDCQEVVTRDILTGVPRWGKIQQKRMKEGK